MSKGTFLRIPWSRTDVGLPAQDAAAAGPHLCTAARKKSLPHLSLFLWILWRRGLWNSCHFFLCLPLPFLWDLSLLSPTDGPIQGRISSGRLHMLTPTYNRVLLLVTDLSPPWPSTAFLEMSPLVYRCKIGNFILQVYKFHALSRWENGWREHGASYFTLTIARFPVQRLWVHFRWCDKSQVGKDAAVGLTSHMAPAPPLWRTSQGLA